MAFVNEKLTSEQQEAFVKRKISYAGRLPLNPVNQTIDHNRNVCIVYYGVMSKDAPEEKLFFVESMDSTCFVKIRLSTEKKGSNNLIVKWDDFELLLCDTGSNINESMIKDVMKEALSVFGVLGSPEPSFQLGNDSEYIYAF